ncbi:MAG: aldehyde dehydrogenase EutE [Deltaproteobacteria bacterium]|nr:aldehyde dehydrogenase EutE [Deltaproteobacteria bacterium]
MVQIDEAKIAEIVSRVVDRLLTGDAAPASGGRRDAPGATGRPTKEPFCAPSPPAWTPPGEIRSGPSLSTGGGRKGVFDDMDRAVEAAHRAYRQIEAAPLELREKVIDAMRVCARQETPRISEMAVQETGLGRVDDKLKKNLLVANKTPGLEILRPVAVSGDHGLMLTERAPFGVIGAITPTTNPTETIICNSIGMITGGNAVVFNVHPGAKGVSNYLVDKLNQAIMAAGGPENLITSMAEPTIESAQKLMRHPGIRLMVVTGGPAVVKEAMNSGKRAIAAGPGNPPVVVDETADLLRAARGIVLGGSLDNCVVCTAEKEVIAVAEIADLLKKYVVENGGYEVKGAHVERLRKLVVAEDGLHPMKDWVGKDATKILEAIGIRAPEGTRTIIVEGDEQSPFVQAELLMPVLGFVRVPTVDEAIAMAKRVEHGFGHTASMYSTDINNLHKMARSINCSIFTKNAPTYAGLGLGGEGYTSFTIASPTGEGLTNATHFTRERRCTLVDSFRIV